MTLSYNNLFQNGICNKQAQYTKEQNYAVHPGALDDIMITVCGKTANRIKQLSTTLESLHTKKSITLITLRFS